MLTKSRSKAAWLQDALLPSEIPAASDPSRHHVYWYKGYYWWGRRGTRLWIDRQTDTLFPPKRKSYAYSLSFSVLQPAEKMLVTLLDKSWRCGKEELPLSKYKGWMVSSSIKGNILETKEGKVLHWPVERYCIWLWGTQEKWQTARSGFEHQESSCYFLWSSDTVKSFSTLKMMVKVW